jgi:hypothetical protein
MARAVSLSNSPELAFVDDEDYEWALQYTWRLKRSAYSEYVCCTVREGRKFRTLRLHREIAKRRLGDLPVSVDVHHEGVSSLDNRWSVLEVADHQLHGGFRSEHRDEW